MTIRNTRFILCDSDDGPVCINIAQIAYFRNLCGHTTSNKVEIIMNTHANSRVIVDGSVEKLIKILEMG